MFCKLYSKFIVIILIIWYEGQLISIWPENMIIDKRDM